MLFENSFTFCNPDEDARCNKHVMCLNVCISDICIRQLPRANGVQS